MKRSNAWIFVTLVAMFLLIGCASATTHYTISNVQINSATGTGTADLRMDAVPVNGTSGYVIDVAITDPSVIQITDVTYNSALRGMNDNTNTPFTSGHISWLDSNEKLQAGNSQTNILLATIEFTALKTGSTTMIPSLYMLTDDNGYNMIPTSDITPSVALNVYDTPTAAFTFVPISPIFGDTVVFTDASTGNIVSYEWNFGDGATSTLQNPTHAFTAAGTYSVSETVTNPAGTNSVSHDVVVTSAPVPVAAFTTSSTNGLVGTATATFTDASTNTPTSWKWEYQIADNGAWTQFSTSKNPTFTPTVAGTYNIRLTATNAGGSGSATKTHVFAAALSGDPLTTVKSGTVSGDLYVNSVSPWPSTEFTQTFTLPSVAIGNITWARVYVNDYSGSGVNNYWVNLSTDFDGNGNGNYADPGEHLGVEICDVQSETDGLAYPVNDHVTKVYSDYEAWYDVTNLITSATPSVHVNAASIAGSPGYDGRIKGITLIVAYNDGDSDQVKYWVNQGNDWMTGSSSTSFATGALNSGLTSAELRTVGHSSTDATYTLNSGSVAKTSLGTNSYWKYNSFNVTSALSSGATNTVGYTNGGASFKICLATLKARYVQKPTITSFTSSKNPASVNETVTFTAAAPGATSYDVDFGDSTAHATGAGPWTHSYAAAGTYDVVLTATNEGGSIASPAISQVIVDKPIISVETSPQTLNPGESYIFTIRMDRAPTGLSGYDMVVSLSNQSVADITNVTYDSTWALYTIHPTVPADSVRIGAVDAQQKIHDGTNPSTGPYVLAYVTVKGVAAGTTQFALSALNMDDDYGNPIPAVMTDGTLNIGTYAGPTAAFSATPTTGNTTPLTVTFDSSASGGSISTYQWDFGDGSTGTGASPSHDYTALGSYNVKLTVSGPGGSNTLVKNAYITVTDGVKPVVTAITATPGNGNYPLPVAFSAATTGDVSSYAWDFGDGMHSTLATPTHTYTYANDFPVTLVVTGTGGSSDPVTKVIHVTENAPVAGIVANPESGTAQLQVQFTDASTGTISSYNWSFGDGSYSDEQNPVHTFTSAGIFDVTHTVTGPGGVSSPATKTITVTGLGVDFSSDVTTGLASGNSTPGFGHALPVSFTSTVTGVTTGSTTYLWDFGDGSTSTEQNPVHDYYGHVKSFTVTLTIQNGADAASVTKPAYITTTPYVEAFPKDYNTDGTIHTYYTNVPTDTNGDYVYEDVNGNGRVDYDDVVAFYNAYEYPTFSGAWLATNTDVDNAFDYDYSGNGDLGFEDITALYDKILYH